MHADSAHEPTPGLAGHPPDSIVEYGVAGLGDLRHGHPTGEVEDEMDLGLVLGEEADVLDGDVHVVSSGESLLELAHGTEQIRAALDQFTTFCVGRVTEDGLEGSLDLCLSSFAIRGCRSPGLDAQQALLACSRSDHVVGETHASIADVRPSRDNEV